ncbi:gustatory receptor for sugar taste 43a-like isoform X2 [Pectinophora gossypiella]|nr:gustatory receptor for sugar taste 43a-like isoform X2 [Pectinophora gossypiella]XP_049878996.1 gustatory receptor for sugar taste 43a-like isoform X2 [Pectinophora gossypiella]
MDEKRPQELSRISDIVTDIASSYEGACDVLKKISDSFGLLVILMLGAIFIDLVIAPYFLFSVVQNPYINKLPIVMFTSNILWNFANLILFMEPGNGTEVQMNQTKIILSHLLRRVDPSDPLALHLHFFFKQLRLNNSSFTAVGLCTLTRPVILSILGGVTTYLVILLQFASLDKDTF